MIQANDVVVILRPELDDEGNYDGNFKIIHSVAGPVTMQPTHVYDMSCHAILMSLVLEFVEQGGKPLADEFAAYIDKTHPKLFEEVATALVGGGDNTAATRFH